MSPQSRGVENGARFSLRTLLVVVAGVGLILGYWVSLPRILTEWDQLLDLLSQSDRITRWLLVRSAIEIVVAIPAWSIFSVYFSFLVLHFGWI
jgi:hypothetical protein